MSEHIRIGLVSISDRASDGTYEDQGIPALKDWLGKALRSPWTAEPRLIPDVRATIEQTLRTDPRIQGDRELFIRADREARYGVVARVVAAARAAGVEGLNLLVEPNPEPLPSRTAR